MKTVLIQCEHFTWKVFRHGDVYYADGRGDGNGKHSLGTKDERAARDALKLLDRRIAKKQGKIIATPAIPLSATPQRATSLTIADGWDRFLKHCQRSPALGGVAKKTLVRYGAIQKNHLKFCKSAGVATWAQVDSDHATAYGQYLDGLGRAAGTLYMEINTLKTVVKYLINKGLEPKLKPIHLSVYRSSESSRYCYTKSEVSAMLAHCRATPSLSWLGDIVAVLAATGMRIGELTSLRWSDIDWSAKCIVLKDNRFSALANKSNAVSTTKGKRGRRIPLNPQAVAVLGRRHTPSATGPVFTGAASEKISTDSILRAFVRYVIKPLKKRFPTPVGEIGFEHGRLHSFRHYFVSECFRNGVSESHIRDWVGHADSHIIERYRHLHYNDSQKAMQGLSLFDAPATAASDDDRKSD
jgi:integrase